MLSKTTINKKKSNQSYMQTKSAKSSINKINYQRIWDSPGSEISLIKSLAPAEKPSVNPWLVGTKLADVFKKPIIEVENTVIINSVNVDLNYPATHSTSIDDNKDTKSQMKGEREKENKQQAAASDYSATKLYCITDSCVTANDTITEPLSQKENTENQATRNPSNGATNLVESSGAKSCTAVDNSNFNIDMNNDNSELVIKEEAQSKTEPTHVHKTSKNELHSKIIDHPTIKSLISLTSVSSYESINRPIVTPELSPNMMVQSSVEYSSFQMRTPPSLSPFGFQQRSIPEPITPHQSGQQAKIVTLNQCQLIFPPPMSTVHPPPQNLFYPRLESIHPLYFYFPEEPTLTVREAVKRQVSYYFSDENLLHDKYLKSLFDKETGGIPLFQIGKFRRLDKLIRSNLQYLAEIIVTDFQGELELLSTWSVRTVDWERWIQ